MHMGDRLNGKVAVVTGASSGIGEATVRALAVEGAAVVAGARRKERLDELVERVSRDGGEAIAVECDVTDEQQAHDLVSRAVEEFGSIDVLVNNAGVMLLSTVGKSLSDQWRAMFEVNVMGLLYATDAAISHMKEQGSGHLVNISSVAGRKVTLDSSTIRVYFELESRPPWFFADAAGMDDLWIDLRVDADHLHDAAEGL
jgi:NADP-dependent 3-hydroxy acid dehydrogenase YdfG